ncbi:hypothetical protein FHETE_250 [Fusarium heterosporum]|uniref:Uncharacterized protein n=1 Tax=Fusarium heterosporum TaxID=42747 RepID=A0A8H5U3Y6_FUSHE|nr:hypothetical protein FHETE_250 [Fusarium heterosporum]
MALGSFLRSLLRDCFSAGDASDHDKQTQYSHLRGGETPSPARHSRKVRKSGGENKARHDSCYKSWAATRPHDQGQNQGLSQGQGQGFVQNRASGGQNHGLYAYGPNHEKPLPVVPRQGPPQQQYPSKALGLSKALLPLHIQSHNVHDSTDTRQRQRATDEIHVQQRTGSNEAFFSHDRSMNREAVSEVIDMIALRFSHIPYAVSGLAAMVYYGYDAMPYKVSILCPEHTRENQKCWAKAQGMIPIPRRSDIWGLATSDGIVHQIRVRFPWDFEEMHVLKIGSSAVSMLSLAGLADELARTYVNELKHSDHARQDNLAREMVWILHRIIQVRMPEHMLRPERIPHLSKETFWLPFSLAYSETVPLFAKAGWRIPNEGWS